MITIGELANEVAQYGPISTLQVMRDKPFMTSTICTANGYARGYLYIIQKSEHVYSIYDDNTDQHGRRVLPSKTGPYDFVTEAEEARVMLGGAYHDKFLGNTASNLSYFKALWHIYDRLMAYKVVTVTNDTLRRRFASIGFNSPKIRQIIERAYRDRNSPTGSIRDLVEIVNHRKDTFNLSPLKAKELNCVVEKLRDIGIEAEVTDRRITHIKFHQR